MLRIVPDAYDLFAVTVFLSDVKEREGRSWKKKWSSERFMMD